jgi:FtsP/CotA-like multicopper oxidase with cupredoxin domain
MAVQPSHDGEGRRKPLHVPAVRTIELHAQVDEPFLRDTVLIHPREEIDVRVVPTDAGTWMMHCHVLEHARPA